METGCGPGAKRELGRGGSMRAGRALPTVGRPRRLLGRARGGGLGVREDVDLRVGRIVNAIT